MNQRLHIIIITILLLLVSWKASAQDPSFSQFYAPRLYLNPALTGLNEGLTLTAATRQQWLSVPGAFHTYFISAEIQEPYIRSGLGISLIGDVEGQASMRTRGGYLSYSYLVPMKKSNLHFGLQGGYLQKSVDWDKFVFSDQLDAIDGVVRPTTATPVDPTGFFDASAGVAYRWENRIGKKKHTMSNSIGLSASHLTTANESLQGLGTILPRRYTIHAGSVIPITSISTAKTTVSWSPHFKMDWQSNLRVFTYGFYAMYEDLWLGVFHQNKTLFVDNSNTNALTVIVGTELDLGRDKKCLIGYSYDANITGLGTRGGGSHEITLQMNFANARMWRRKPGGKGNRWMQCNKFF